MRRVDGSLRHPDRAREDTMRRSLCLLTVAMVAAWAVLPAPAASATTDLDPGGDIAYVDGGVIRLADLEKGTLVDLDVGRAPVWSPDGRDLAYEAQDGAEMPLRVLSSGVELPTGLHELDWAWSPDGDEIAWVSRRENDLWVTDVATGQSRNLTNGSVDARYPQWTPNGRTIVFEAEGHISTVAATGGPVRQVVAGGAPATSPDGRRIAYTWRENETTEVLSHVAIDGSDPRHLVSLTEVPCGIRRLEWSPDGTRIGYSVSCGGSPVLQSIEFFVIPASGGKATSIGKGSAFRAAGPFWSPDGDRLALVEGGWSTKNVILVDPDGSAPITLTGTYPDCTAHPSWSPDGSRIGYESYPAGCEERISPPPPPSDIAVASRTGREILRLAPGSEPAWRPAPYEVGLVDPGTGIWRLNGITEFYYGNPGDLPFLGDWDGDGVATPGLYRRSDGYVYLRNSNTQGVADIRFFFGNPGDIPLAGDFDGDGFDTVSLYRPSTGQVFVINELGSDDRGLGAAEISYYFGNPGDKPCAGDFDGDGVDTVGLHRESTGFVYLRNSHTPGVADVAFYYGNPGDRLLAGDWIGDGKDTVGVYRPSTTMFHLRFTNSHGIADASFVRGRSTWIPVAGPFDD